MRIPLGLHENTRSAIVPLHPILPTSLIMGVKTGQVSERSGDCLGSAAGQSASWIMGAEAAKTDTRVGRKFLGRGHVGFLFLNEHQKGAITNYAVRQSIEDPDSAS